MKKLSAIFLIFIIAACSSGPAEIHFGHDECAFCRMQISEPNFASQLRTDKGKVYKFDSIECLAALEAKGETVTTEQIAERWVPDFSNRNWVDATSAQYLHSETLRSPMGLFLSAYETEESAKEHQRNYRGKILGYDDVKALVSKEWLGVE